METNEKLQYLKKIYGFLKNPNNESLKLSMKDTHQKGIFSLVISGTEFGKLTRVFICTKKLKAFDVQLHTHRYPIKLTTIKGKINQYVAIPVENTTARSQKLSLFHYNSPLNGGEGLKYLKEVDVFIGQYPLPNGSTINMRTDEFHTMSCSKGSIWIVEEQGFETDSSKVLGVPFVTDGLYNEPKSFQINDNCQLVAKAVKKIILDYEIVQPLKPNQLPL